MPHMVLLGVGTGVPDADRDHTHMVWDGGDAGGGTLLIDAGGSTYQRLLKSGVDPQALGGILLTHSHADHINGLPVLLFSLWLAGRREKPVPIYGLPVTLEVARRYVESAYLEQIVAPVEWIPVQAGDAVPLGSDTWTLRTTLTDHSRPCLALRFEEKATGRRLVYSADTRPCAAVEELARGAEILIHEATTAEPFPSHTTPRQAGEVAARAGAKRLVLVHYSPHWTMPEEQALAEVRAGGFPGTAEIGREYQALEMP
jgi:ribonuclease Z